MLKTYLFVPANNQRFIRKIPLIPADYIIFDLEDSVIKDEVASSFQNLKTIVPESNHYIRLNIFPEETGYVDLALISESIGIGFRNFIIPKYRCIAQIEALQSILIKHKHYTFDSFRFILLIEHPLGLYNLHETIQRKILNIEAIGFGSHDYCNVTGMKHILNNLAYVRQLIVNSAKAFGLSAIDFVSLHLDNDQIFCEEAYDGFSLGFTGKFIIHPKQIELIKGIQYYSTLEVAEAKSIYKKILEIQKGKVAVVRLNGKIYEKPHINKIIDIIKWSQDYGSE